MEICPSCHLGDDVSPVDGMLTCGRCNEALPGQSLVWISGSGAVYHRTRLCGSLIVGQLRAEREGKNVASVAQRTRAGAQAEGRPPCPTCTPPGWRT